MTCCGVERQHAPWCELGRVGEGFPDSERNKNFTLGAKVRTNSIKSAHNGGWLADLNDTLSGYS